MAEGDGGQVSKWTSRRFLLAAVGLVVSVFVILGKIAPDQSDSAVQVIVGAATLALSIVGYQVTEAAVDKARAGNGTSEGGDK